MFAAKRLGIDNLQEYGIGLIVRLHIICTTVAAQPHGQDFEHGRQGRTLVAMVGATHRQNPAAIGKYRRVVGEIAIAVFQVFLRQLFAFPLRTRHIATSGDGHTDIKQQGVVRRRRTEGDGVGRKQWGFAALRGNGFFRGRGAGENADTVALDNFRQVCGKTGDMLATTNGRRHYAVFTESSQRLINRLIDYPWARQKVCIPVKAVAAIG